MPEPIPGKSTSPGLPPRGRVGADTLAALALAAAWAGAVVWGAPTPLAPGLGLAGLALGAVVLRRRCGGALVGPLFFYDLVRLARRGRSTLLRCTYALLLLAGLCVVYADRFPSRDLWSLTSGPRLTVPAHEMTRFAGTFVGSILLLQGAAVVVLTPAYLAGAIAEEKERRTLEMLFTTHLGDHEIVLGKLFARLTHLAGILLTGLPVLSLTQLWGGVDGVVLAGNFAAAALTLLSVGSLSILCSVLSRSVLTALVSAYGVLLVLGLFCLGHPLSDPSPFGFQREMERRLADARSPASGGSPAGVPGLRAATTPPPAAPADPTRVVAGLVGEYALVHGLLALLCGGCAIAVLRPVGLPENSGPPPALPAVVPVERLPGPPSALPGASHAAPPGAGEDDTWRPSRSPVTDPPLLWKELYHGARGSGPVPDAVAAARAYEVLILLLFIAGLVLLAAALSRSDPGKFVWWELNVLLRVLTVLLASTWCLGLAFRAAASVSRERDARTLTALLTLPVERAAILRAKWLGAVLRTCGPGYVLLATWTFGLLTSALHPLAALLLALACASHIAFLASLGLWLSLACRNTLWAQMSMALMLLVVFSGSWLVLSNSGTPFLSGAGPPDGPTSFIAAGLNPPGAWWTLGFSWGEFADALAGNGEAFRVRLSAALAGILFFAGAAAALWRAACRRLRAEEAG